MFPKISVIVPVYKAEKYLHRCVDSILAQTFTDFEVLVSENNRLNQAVVKLSEQLALQQKHRFSGHSQKKNKVSDVPSGETASDR